MKLRPVFWLAAAFLVLALVLGVLVYRRVSGGDVDRSRLGPGAGTRILEGVEEEACTGFRVSFSNERFELRREGGTWRITGPAPEAAEADAGAAMVKNFLSMEAVEVVASTNADLRPFGLDEPPERYDLFVTEKAGPRTLSFFVGRRGKAPDGFWLRASFSSNVTYVAPWVVLSLRKPLAEMRPRAVTGFEPEAILRLSWAGVTIDRAGLYWDVKGLRRDQVDVRIVDGLVEKTAWLRGDQALPDSPAFPGPGIADPLDVRFSARAADGRVREHGLRVLKVQGAAWAKRDDDRLWHRIDASYSALFAGGLTNLMKRKGL